MNKDILVKGISSVIDNSVCAESHNAFEIMEAIIQVAKEYAMKLSPNMNYEQARNIAMRLSEIDEHLALCNAKLGKSD